jgi:hypothetical protein
MFILDITITITTVLTQKIPKINQKGEGVNEGWRFVLTVISETTSKSPRYHRDANNK